MSDQAVPFEPSHLLENGSAGGHHDSPQQQQQPQQQQAASSHSSESVTKTLTRLMSIPSNRSCADCKSPLVDALQVYASYSYSGNNTAATATTTASTTMSPPIFNSFQQNHHQFAPPGAVVPKKRKRRIPAARDPPVDPAVTASRWCGHSVFVCALCGAAHQLLPRTVTTVAAVHDPQHWTIDRVHCLDGNGGNARATAVLEAYYNNSNNNSSNSNNSHCWRRPNANSTLADRLTFCRAKYEALAFCLPPAVGRGAGAAWKSLVQRHPEWKRLWRGNHHRNDNIDDDEDEQDWTLMPSLSGLELMRRQRQHDSSSNINLYDYPSANRLVEEHHQQQQQQPAQRHTADLPDRLVDYFCVVTASDFLHPSCKDLREAQAPEDILLAPQVTDCFPDPNNNNNGDDADSFDSRGNDNEDCDDPAFPEHVSTFVFPDGCHASATALPPAFFTLVLTNAAGERLYGGVLRIYDDCVDTVETLRRVLDHSEYPEPWRPAWLQQRQQQQQQQQSSPTAAFETPPHSTKRASVDSACSQVSTNSRGGSDVMFLPKCLIVLSHHPFFDLWRNFLLQIYRIALTEAPLPMERFVANFVREVPLPPPGKVQVKFGFTVKDIWTIERPPENQLPLANFSFQPLFASLSVSNVMVVVGCLLQETRVALVSQHYALLGPVAEALLSFLFPFHWQGMYLTLVPRNMLDILDAPVPYLVGLHARYLRETPASERPHGVVFVDLDRDEVHLGFDDDDATSERTIPSLPDRDAGKLKDMLLKHATCAYILPSTQSVGSILTGGGRQILHNERENYAQISSLEKTPPDSFLRRQDVFSSTDKAFRVNELLDPISGFLSEHGQLYQRDASRESMHRSKNKKPLLRLPPAFTGRRYAKGGETTRSHSMHSHHSHHSFSGDMDSNHVGNLLDLKEQTGFSSTEIRNAFLRFFVSLFRDYRKFLDETGFHDENFLLDLGLSASNTAFVRSLLKTQMFQVFAVERVEDSNDPEVLFFDDSITAKINRSKKATLARGGKKETKFLDDTGSMVTETFTPPPPSNWGLENGKTYQYGTFPSLNPDLFGQTRPPMTFAFRQRRSSIRLSRRMTAVVQANEQVVVEKATRSLLTVTKRGVKNLESALKALSTPFGPPRRTTAASTDRQTAKDSPNVSIVSDVTMPSTFDLTDDVVSSAEVMILNARRKQAILIGIIVKLQRLCRQFLERKRIHRTEEPIVPNATERAERIRLQKQLAAAVRVQRCFRFARKRRAATRIQAWRRGNTICLATGMLVDAIVRTQAVCRGVVARKQLRQLLSERIELYRKQIFKLWQLAGTPLTYRSKFWPLLKPIGFVRLVIAENELKRLWKDLSLKPPSASDRAARNEIDALHPDYQLGIRSDCYSKCLGIGETLSASRPKTKQLRGSKTNCSIPRGSPAERVLAERLQVYERLSLPAFAELTNESFDSFLIPQKDKRRKVALANIVWCNYEEAGRSAELFIKLFPELRDSTNIFFMQPSKKALRRFPLSNIALPLPLLDETMWAHRILDDRIRHHTTEIADISLHQIPARMDRLEKALPSKRCKAQSRMIKSVMSSRSMSNESMARLVIIRKALFGTADVATAPHIVEAEPTGSLNRKARNASDKSNGVSIAAFPGANFWEQDDGGTSTVSLATSGRNGNAQSSRRGESFPGDRFWVRQ